MVTKTYKVNGYYDGENHHRIKESFSPSYTYDFSEDGKTRIIEVICSDKTGTNDFVYVRITADTAEECENEIHGQVDDGIFENQRTGRIEEVDDFE